jgi:hypothetical protein
MYPSHNADTAMGKGFEAFARRQLADPRLNAHKEKKKGG